ncbi:hypothetical protein [Nonomuraea sediminis]|uniref:hypothetical protein n=1 Tax=Nonomuraea sediminis TaxID=2835864 RepID=UPI001BDC643B|nr:hypothetical protein [Nonomuraea sediminis]
MNTDRCWLFDLRRFDEPDEPDPGNQDPDPEPDPDDKPELGEKGKQALDRMKAERNAARRELAEKTRKLAELEDRDKSDAEKLATRAEKAEAREKSAIQRAVKAEVRALAAEEFRDTGDADLLGDLTKYVNGDGDIDLEAIQADLADLLERKPHLRKSTEPAKKTPKPDPSQGSRKEPGPVDYRTADKADVDAELARLGVRSW